jgi:putative ABC transport system substrate-binding protein
MARNGIPAMYEDSRFVEAGGLMSYGPNLGDVFRWSASFCRQDPQWRKSTILPVEQPTKFDLVINLKTAKAPPG